MKKDLPDYHFAKTDIPAYDGFAPNVLVLSNQKKPYTAIVPGFFIMGEE